MAQTAQATNQDCGYAFAMTLTNGNASTLARIVGVSPQAVAQWKRKGVVPANSAKKIAKTFGVPRERLNPEIFGK